MTAPDSFIARLKDEFHDALRIRWSLARNEFHIEQKVGRAALPPIHISEADDDMIRARDGYAFVLAVRQGNRMPCPRCNLTLPVPIFQFAEVVCPRCRTQKLDGRYIAGFYPLDGDMLLDHLRSIDPNRRNPQFIRDMDARNARIEASRDRAAANERAAATYDHYNQLVGIQSVGYTKPDPRLAS